MNGSFVRLFFTPVIWLSDRLSFPCKYSLIGIVFLTSLAALSVPLWWRMYNDIQLTQIKRHGLEMFVFQTNILVGLVTARSNSMDNLTYRLPTKLATSVRTLATQKIQPLETGLKQIQELEAENMPLPSRFAAYTGIINTLLGIIRDEARIHRLNADSELDAVFDMLTNRLPLVLETLGKQQDALALHSDEMISYSLSAQVVLAESIIALNVGIEQLATLNLDTTELINQFKHLSSNIATQQEIVDNVLSDNNYIGELRKSSKNNRTLVQTLLSNTVYITDSYLLTRINLLNREQWMVAALLSGAIFIIFYIFAGIYLSILRSLKTLSKGTDAFCSGNLDARVTLETKDELVLVARNFNTVATEVKCLLEVIYEQNESRERELENQVHARTAELLEAKQQAESALARQQEMQHELVQTEKLAALGGLVAGIAHEINTPIGIALSAATHLEAETHKTNHIYAAGELSEEALMDYFTTTNQASYLVTTNIQRAANLIQSFKRVAVDQTSDERRIFNLATYIDEVLLSLHPFLKNTHINIRIHCPPDLILDSLPGAISQILTNLIMNAVFHAFDLNQPGYIDIKIQHTHEIIDIMFSDNGKGIPSQLHTKVFEPFFTTRRNTGGSGLGLHIVHTIVTQVLKGSIKLTSIPNQGTVFNISIPHTISSNTLKI